MKIGTSSLLRFILAGILALGTFSFAWAQFSGGSGTPASPYQVANVNQLNSIRNHLSAHFVQIADLDLDIAPYNQGTGWQPIGSDSNPFTGSFDGAGFSIMGLYINNPAADYQALFGYTRNASIQGITLDNAMVNGKDYSAALVACAENSQITDCHISGSINGAANSGGLVGSLEMMSSLSNSSAEINLSGTNAIGGLCGYLKGSSLVSGSVARGAVSGGTAVGGLVGILADSEISDCYSRAAVSGTRYIGGLLGINDLDGQVNRCYSTGLVSGNQNTGGLIGRSILAHTTDSYWDTQTSGQASSAGGEARNTEQMLPPYEGNTYAAWDFASIWNAHPTYNDGYPYLEWEYTVPSVVALLVYNKNNLNAYDTGFINVLNTITTDYEMIDIAEISSGQKNLSTYRVVISNFMGFGTTAATAFNSIAAQLEAATQAGTEFIVGSESVSIPVVLGLANGAMNGYFVPALNNTRAISELAINDAITAGVNPIPDYQSYLGQDGLMLSNYFGEGVFWKVMSGGIGDYYRLTTFIQNPVFRLNTIYSGFDVSDYQYPDGPMEFRKNNSRILNLKRFWTQNNDTRAKGWIGPEGIQILSNAISHYLATDYVETPPSELGGVFYTINGSQRTIHWDAVVDADYYEIWYSTDGSTWNPIGLQSEDGSGSYAWLSPITTANLYRVRPILGDTPGAFVDALPALAEITVMPSSVNLSLPAESLISETFEIVNIGLGDLEFNSQILEGFRDLSIIFSPAQGVLAAGDTLLCELHVDSAATEPGQYEFTLQITSNDPDNPVINIPIAITVTSPIAYIPDDNFRMAINVALGQDAEYQPSIQDLESLNGTLDASEGEITNIEGAQHLSGLTAIRLNNNSINDLSPLGSLYNLQTMYLYYNQISDLSPLSNLTGLIALHLNQNLIYDLSPLSSLTNLEWLHLDYNQIHDISPLISLTNLQRLHLNHNQIVDISPLSYLPNLQRLYLGYNLINDISPLSNYTELMWLDLNLNQISDLHTLLSLNVSGTLYLNGNPISYESWLMSTEWAQPWHGSTYNQLSPCYPEPERAAMDVAPDAGLSWQANYDSSSTALYQVYLGTSSDALTYIGDGTWVNGTTYSYATNLEPFTEYWWRVKAIDGDTEIWSGMWSFATGEEVIPEEAIIAVTPQFIEHSLLQDSTDQVELEITNSGNAALNWTATVEEVRREASAPVAIRPRVTAELRRERDSRPGMERYELTKPEESERESSLLRARNVLLALDPDNGLVEAESSVFCWLNIDSYGSLSGTYEYQIVITSNAVNEPELIIPVSITVEGTPAYIPDDNFRMAINNALEQPADYQPTVQDLESLDYLDAESYGISSLEGAEYLSNLDGLDLAYNQISDLSPLSNLSNLQGLYLDFNQISDLNPLSNLSNLQELRLWNNQISDLSPLYNLSNLYYLELSYNQISDLSPLANLSNLENLDLGTNQISDLNPLANLNNLYVLFLYYNQISDITPLSNLSNLQYLYLGSNPISYESMILSQSWSLPYTASTYEPLSPCYPDPLRIAIDVAPDAGLSWQANYNSSSTALYQVYLGTSSDALTYIGEGAWVNGTTYSYATNLEPFTEYWWRVKAIDGVSEIWSGIWSFTTGEEESPTNVLFTGAPGQYHNTSTNNYAYHAGTHYLVWSQGRHTIEGNEYDGWVKLSTSSDGIGWTTQDLIYNPNGGSEAHCIVFDEEGYMHLLYLEETNPDSWGMESNDLVYATNTSGEFTKTVLANANDYLAWLPAALTINPNGTIHVFYNRCGWYSYNSPLYERHLSAGEWSEPIIVSDYENGSNDPDDFENSLNSIFYDNEGNMHLLVSSGWYYLVYQGDNTYANIVFEYEQIDGSYVLQNTYYDTRFMMKTGSATVSVAGDGRTISMNGEVVDVLPENYSAVNRTLMQGKDVQGDAIVINTVDINTNTNQAFLYLGPNYEREVIEAYIECVVSNGIMFKQMSGSSTQRMIAVSKLYDSAPLEVAFDSSSYEGEAPFTVSFEPTITGSYETMLWDFGDGFQSNDTYVEHQYDEAGEYVVRLSANQGWQHASTSITITVNEPPFSIPDDNFRLAINAALEQGAEYQPTEEDMNLMAGFFSAPDMQIQDITGASLMTNVTGMNLQNNQISDLSPLAGLSNLEILILGSNQCNELYPLSGLTSLHELWLHENQIEDIRTLANCTSLNQLVLYSNQINDVSPLSDLSGLQELNLTNNMISDFYPLAGLTGLDTLYLADNYPSYESMLLSQSWELPYTTSYFHPVAPCYPEPQRAAMGVAPDAGLSWQANYNSSSTALYQVYLGTSSDDLTYIGEGTWVNGTTYSYATNLEPITEYWWRVKAIDGASEIWSGMWSFTTGTASGEFAGGSGSESDPYQVATAEHLNNVRNHLDAHFIQAADIDLGVSPWNDGDGWQPIGSDAERFSGVYFGNDYSINQMSISRPSESNLGLFGVLDGAIIHNLHVSASDVTGINWCGIIIGRAYNSDFFNCHAEGSVTGTGGSIGGLMGRMDNSSLYYSSFDGTVTSSGAPVGALIGRLDASEIGSCWAIADVSGGSIVGGLAGYTLSNSTIYESYSSGSASSSGDYVGGITGSAAYTISITSCYSHSAVSGNSYVGGLIGETDGATLSGCYSTGTVEGNSNTGGLVGFNTAASSAEDCYWDTDSSLLSTSVLGFGRSTAEMTYPYAMNTYNNWDFNEIWAADLDHETNSGYPYFRWYATAPDYHPPRFVQAGLDIPGARVMWYSPLVGLPSSYQVHRLIPGQETDEALWTLVADAVADTIFFDTDWESLPEGTYKWAVKARYSDQLSIAEFSDELYKELFFEPIISVNPSSVSQAMESNSFAEVPISIGNIGSGNLEWNATLTDRHRNSTVQTHLSKTSGSSRVYSILFSPESGSIPAGSEYICMLSIDTSGATAGTELFELTIYSNDPVTPVYVIPISIEVLPPATNNAPIVSNVRATQRDDDSMQIDIYYDVHDADGDAMSITMEVSDDDGLNWNLSCEEILPGSDIGAGILSGVDKHIVWDAAVEHPNLLYGNNFRFRITADDGVADMPDNFVFVEGGTFNNGTSDVTLSSFYIDKYEVTQAGYQAVMGVNPSYFPGNPNRPVEQVSWFNAIEYCNRRSMQEGLTPCYSYSTYGSNPDNWPAGWNTDNNNHPNVNCNWTANGYRLPTEMEWMFAAKGGNQSQSYTYSGSNTIGNVAWYRDNSDIGDGQGTRTHDVGLKDPNELGTFDMSGNVLEWVWDIWGTYPSGNQTNPTGADSGSGRVIRGGSWYSHASGCTVSFWFNVDATYTVYSIGFRVLRVSP